MTHAVVFCAADMSSPRLFGTRDDASRLILLRRGQQADTQVSQTYPSNKNFSNWKNIFAFELEMEKIKHFRSVSKRKDNTMPTLSGFADEISMELNDQIKVMNELGLKYFDLRQMWGKGVLDLTDDECKKIKNTIAEHGIQVAAIGSPIGKSKIDEPEQFELDRVKHAADLAEFFGSKYIRIFSFYPPEGQQIADYRDEVIRRIRSWGELLEKENRDVVLTLENEKGIYGDIGKRCVDLITELYSPKIVNCFDPANFVNVGEKNLFETCWKPLREYTGFIHLKDCLEDCTTIVPCGEGAGDVELILDDAYKNGYDGFLTLEPHLMVAGHSSGFTGADLFKKAVNAVKDICKKNNIPLN